MGKDQDICLSGHLAGPLHLGRCHVGAQRGVELEFSVDFEIRTALPRDLDRLYKLLYAGGAAAAAGGKAQEGAAGLPAHQAAGGLAACDGDAGKLFRARVDVQRAVRHGQHVSLRPGKAGDLRQGQHAGGVDAVPQADAVLGCQQYGFRRVDVAAEHTVHIVRGGEDHRIMDGIIQLLPRLFQTVAPLAVVHIAFRQRLLCFRVVDVRDGHPLGGDACTLCGLRNHDGIVHQKRVGDALIQHPSGGQQRLFRFTLRQRHPLRVSFRLCDQLVDEAHPMRFSPAASPAASIASICSAL